MPKACPVIGKNSLSDVFRAAVKKDASGPLFLFFEVFRENQRLESAGVEEDYLLLRADDVP
jgi:hypothetical protein